ncbi:hypothetical protein PAAG_01277 [Paracoccidioides lutzii Pb01]|uniref:Enoyl reductase (ER) domain-containing protein n=1 Tax=Paracoccidioides lutzii (strain ATCC MYA-826 / Pb01) TaxID=502779 RepID=C1GRY2_PARBA|nr:hypothetical protein PAAG_01277 [Paracoccidioides lutzii Pb01]EEH38356.2 hypothetical protein PAAG_01277 [Paracoccidioides lutzii Pb01]
MRMIMSYYLTILLQKIPPTIPEFDFSGIVVALSVNAKPALRAEFPPGAPVLGMNDRIFEAASGLAAVACTAMNLVTRTRVKKGDRVLVNGGSSGTGLMTIQLVKDIVGVTGRVVAVCSVNSEAAVKGVIHYTTHDPLHSHPVTHHSHDSANGPFDLIFDTISVQDLYTHSAAYLVRSISSLPQTFLCIGPSKHRIEKVSKFFEEGKLGVVVGSVWEMDGVMKAYERSMTRHTKGKVIVKIQEV